MKRLDKFLADMNIGTRSQVKSEIRKGIVTVNNMPVTQPDYKISEEDVIAYKGNILQNQTYFYYMLNKPAGVITATRDQNEKTVLSLFQNTATKNLFPVGRLDKDTEGLLIITNDGPLGHKLLSPKYHIAKTYYVKIRDRLSDEDCNRLENGIDIGEKNLTRPAKIKRIDEFTLYMTITEGKYHQIKRMFEKVSNQVVYLKRVSMGNLSLDESLKPGEYRPLTAQEISCLKNFT